MAAKVLIVDDDRNICELLRLYLEKDGYATACAYDGQQALSVFADFQPALVLLDVMLPRLDGWQVCREIRKAGDTPVILLTAKGETYDKVFGLELGADDYVTKPFEPKEVLARVKAVLRRGRPGDPASREQAVRYDRLAVNLTNYELLVDGQPVDAPPKELELLYYLASNPNRVFTRDQLLDAVWSIDFLGDSRTVDVHVKRLRSKLDGVSDQWSLKTVWGVGYKFEVRPS